MTEEITFDMEELSSAEEFLEYFQISYEPSIVQVNRLHILQRFHDYLKAAEGDMPQEESALRAYYAGWLDKAYQDFVNSDARSEKVFKVFRMLEPQQVTIPLSDLLQGVPGAAS